MLKVFFTKKFRWQISKKDLLGKNFSEMKEKFGEDAFGFHPVTYILPEDKARLIKHMTR
jgi:hypothetical protein